MEKLSDKIIRKIKDEKICPKPRWQFLLKDYFVWLVFLISLIVGAVAFCTALHVFFTNDWYLYQYLHTTFIGHVLISIPYVWFGVLIVFILIAYYNFKYTKSGYRHETYFVVALSVVGSLLLGTFLHTLGTGERIEEMVAASVPFYERITCCSDRKDVWDQPEYGLLGGKITNVFSEEDFELMDFNGFNWKVRESEETIEYEPLEIRAGEEVKIIGKKEQDFVFWAREIRPWKKKGEIRKTRIRAEE
ncbi:MAG: hypothetical protein A3J76_05080 [Candidatus Moranbacteria bacterium RBG_13_45_13]|nr:MAG: hypothetical protein A3J76_05080 [Candidatus Moranbacteria bacterium RBG_13_45_13]